MVILVAVRRHVVTRQLQALHVVNTCRASVALWNDAASLRVNSASVQGLALVKRLSIVGIKLVVHAACVSGIDERLLLAVRAKSSLACGPPASSGLLLGVSQRDQRIVSHVQ